MPIKIVKFGELVFSTVYRKFVFKIVQGFWLNHKEMVVQVELQSLIHGANGSEVLNNPSENAETHTRT